MFLGEVLSSRLLKAGESSRGRRFERANYIYAIRVLETFSATASVGQEVQVLSGTGGADCSFHFLLGQRYLIDTFPDSGVLFTGVCLLTRPERLATVELETLRLLASGRKVPDVMGTVAQYFPGHPSDLFGGPLDPLSFPAVPKIEVELRPMKGGQAVAALSDEEGVFRMENLMPGQYKIGFNLPKGLVNANPSWDADAMLLTVPDTSTTGPMCRVDLSVGASGSISGRVLQRRGKQRVDEQIRVYLVGEGGASETLANSIWPQDDGSFRLGFLGPGRYRIDYHVRGRQDVAYPQQITLAEGEQKVGVEFRLPSSK